MARIVFTGNTRISPAWAADFGGREHILPVPAMLDPTQFTDQAGIVVSLTASAAQNATSLAIMALTLSALANTIVIAQGDTLLPQGAVLNFGSGKFAVLTAPAINGATTLSVAAIPTAMAGTESAVWSQYNTEFIPSGTLVSRNDPNRTSTALWGAASNLTDTDIYLTYFDLPNASIESSVELYRHLSLVKENYLPNYSLMTADTGITTPSVAPVPTGTGTAGTLGVGAYNVGYTWVNANGETAISPLAAVTLTSTQSISVASIAFPTGASSMKIYVSSDVGDPTMSFAKEILVAGATLVSVPPTGGPPPTSNTTVGLWGTRLLAIRKNYTTIGGYN